MSGLILTTAFPKLGLSVLAWFALVPLFFALRDVSPKSAFRIGMVAGLAHFLSLLYWVIYTMHHYGFLPWWLCFTLLLLLATYLSLYTGLFAMVLVRFCRKPAYLVLLAPVFWVALEYARGFMFSGFPWGLVGYSQSHWLHVIQIADIFGVYGVSFVVVAVNAAVYVMVGHVAGKKWQGQSMDRWLLVQNVAICLILMVFVVSYGTRRLDAVKAEMTEVKSYGVALVQGNIEQAIKWHPAFQISTTKKYVDMTIAASEHDPKLVVWPETATPFYLGASPKLTRLVTDAAKKTGAYLLVGSPRMQRTADERNYYNSAYMVTPQGKIDQRYDKVHLVPFGEYVPLKRLLFFAGKMVAQVGDFSAGEKGRTLNWIDEKTKIGVQICFEIIFPGLSRSLAKNGAGVLVNLTNDAWFGKSAAAYQHFSMTVFRAVENRRSLVRCANTGISGFVDPTGRIAAQTALFEDAVVSERVPILADRTIYTSIGDLMPQASLLFLCIFLARDVIQRRREASVLSGLRLPHRLQQIVGRLAGKRR